MPSAYKIEWVKAGLRNATPDQNHNQDIYNWLYGKAGTELTDSEQIAFVSEFLKGSSNDWQIKVFSLIQGIPSGHLISYGELAEWANQKFGLTLNPRNTAWLRRKIYRTIGHDTVIPIHRIAKKDDVMSANDHPVTQEVNKYKRAQEGSLNDPVWMQGHTSRKE